jgi:HSP20 family molecular chaperone IbpA
MNRTVAFDSPLLLGFERTRALMERAARIGGEGYPPYNVEADGEDRVRITLAVAGLTSDQLTVSVEDNQLTIVGTKEPETADSAERAFLHRGIAARGFIRGFVLADGLEVTSATLEDGLLTIDAVRPPPAHSVRTVPIRTVQ